jgi:hypothetical protein
MVSKGQIQFSGHIQVFAAFSMWFDDSGSVFRNDCGSSHVIHFILVKNTRFPISMASICQEVEAGQPNLVG